jgi:hypothetical protein
MNYTTRKIIYFIMFWVTLSCGAVAFGVAQSGNPDESKVKIFGMIFIIGAFATYVFSWFIHDHNDGKDF